MNINNVSLTTDVINGTAEFVSALGLSVAAITMVSTFVLLQPSSSPIGGTCFNSIITVVNSSLAAEHTASLASSTNMLAVMSLLASVSSTMSMHNTSIILSVVKIMRRFAVQPPASSWIPAAAVGFVANATGHLQFAHISRAAPSTYVNLVNALQGGVAAQEWHHFQRIASAFLHCLHSLDHHHIHKFI